MDLGMDSEDANFGHTPGIGQQTSCGSRRPLGLGIGVVTTGFSIPDDLSKRLDDSSRPCAF
jgi:hypothetical protein